MSGDGCISCKVKQSPVFVLKAHTAVHGSFLLTFAHGDLLTLRRRALCEPLLHDKPDYFICFDARVRLTRLGLRRLVHTTLDLRPPQLPDHFRFGGFQASWLSIHVNSFRAPDVSGKTFPKLNC